MREGKYCKKKNDNQMLSPLYINLFLDSVGQSNGNNIQ